MNSRQKGARGERSAAKAWAETLGLDPAACRRGQQFHGGNDSPDVVQPIDRIHLEVKNVQRGNPYDWIDQAVRDAGEKIPVVLHKRNFCDWLLVVRLCDVTRLAQEISAQAAALGAVAVPGAVPRPGVSPPAVGDGGSHGLPADGRRRRAGGDRNRRESRSGELDSHIPGGVGACTDGAPNGREGGNR